jgi:hypothetical protein
MRRVQAGPVVILPRPDDQTVDVFTGNKGWAQHTVFKVVNGKVSFLGGTPLSPEDFKTFKAKL